MRYNRLGRTDVEVSEICLGSMTWGTQNTQAEGHEQMDYAFDAGVNFIDTAQMYPTTPMSEETWGRTEEVIGSWCKARNNRHKAIIATKVTGDGIDYIHGGVPISPAKIQLALEGSLQRLQTDYIDVYQLHWPNRGSYHFRQWPKFDPYQQPKQDTLDNMHEVLSALQAQVAAGKIRTVGLSNESAWGTAKILQIAEQHNLPRVVSVQNEYNLLNRLYDLDMAELSHHEDVGLLAFSPLAAGLLSGKYRHGEIPAGSRRTLNDDLSGRLSEYSKPALEQYFEIADKHQLHPAQMAIAFCTSRPFMASTIIGATTMDQLKTDIAATEITLSAEILEQIDLVRRQHPMPV